MSASELDQLAAAGTPSPKSAPPAKGAGNNTNVSPKGQGATNQGPKKSSPKGNMTLRLPKPISPGRAKAAPVPVAPKAQLATPDKFHVDEGADESSSESGDDQVRIEDDGITDTQAERAMAEAEAKLLAGANAGQGSARALVDAEIPNAPTGNAAGMNKWSDDVRSTGTEGGTWYIEPDQERNILVFCGSMYGPDQQKVAKSQPQVLVKVIKANPHLWLAMLDFDASPPKKYCLKITSMWDVASINSTLAEWNLEKNQKGNWRFVMRFDNWAGCYDAAVREGPVTKANSLTEAQQKSIELLANAPVLAIPSRPPQPAPGPEPVPVRTQATPVKTVIELTVSKLVTNYILGPIPIRGQSG